jgi:hypothetical protein
MNIKPNDDYYFWCCEWCDSENLVLWTKVQNGTTCGACHKPMIVADSNPGVNYGSIAAGLC